MMLDGTARSPGLCVRGCLRLAVACGQCGAVRCDPGPLRHPQSPFGVPKCSVFTVLSSLVVNRTADAIELSNGITVEVRAASFRRLCGVTCVAVIASEAAFWLDETSANADVEIFNAGKYETAAALLRDRILLVPGTDFSRVLLASALGHLGDPRPSPAHKEIVASFAAPPPDRLAPVRRSPSPRRRLGMGPISLKGNRTIALTQAAPSGSTGLQRTRCSRSSLPREAPRLCRGGSNSLTCKAVVHR
jgi:hypothetical protein